MSLKELGVTKGSVLGFIGVYALMLTFYAALALGVIYVAVKIVKMVWVG